MSAYAQSNCSAPTLSTSFNANNNITYGDCRQTGTIHLQNLVDGNGSYQYRLLDQNQVQLRGWQDNASFPNLADGTYYVEVHEICTAPVAVSNPVRVTKPFVLASTYVNPSVNNVITPAINTVCGNNGFIEVGGISNGTGPYQYSLISSLTAPSPDPNAIRPLQTSNRFENLNAGTYYVRVMDACGETGATYTTTIDGPGEVFYDDNDTKLTWLNCDSFILKTQHTNLKPGYTYNYWYTLPTGNTATKSYIAPQANINASTSLLTISDTFNIDRLGTGAYPMNVQYNVEVCGQTYTRTESVHDRYNDLRVNAVLYSVAANNDCDNVSYQFSITSFPRNEFSSSVAWNKDVTYSLDGGVTRLPLPANGVVEFPRNVASLNYKVYYCNRELSGYANTNTVISGTIAESNYNSCYGNSGIRMINITGILGDQMRVTLINSPAGSNLTFDKTINAAAAVSDPFLYNLPIGSYTFRVASVSTTCNNIYKDFTIDLIKPLQEPQILLERDCNGDLIIECRGEYNLTASAASPYSPSSFSAYLGDANGNAISGGLSTLVSDNNGVIIHKIEKRYLDNIPYGNYNIITNYNNRVASGQVGGCNKLKHSYIHQDNATINMSNTLHIGGCNNNEASSMVIGNVSGGKAPYIWELRQGATLIERGNNNIFTGLTSNASYAINLTDACGRNTNSAVPRATVSVPMSFTSSALNPCEGDEVVFSLDNNANLNYTWYKDDVIIPNETSNVLVRSNLQAIDAGVYKGAIADANSNCVLLTNAAYLDPINCNISLPLTLISFKGHLMNNKAVLSWVTINEKENKGFIIEKSENGTTWESLDFVASTSTAFTQENHYTYIDENVSNNSNVYRLKSVAFNGDTDYSHLVRIAGNALTHNISIMPNIITNNTANIAHAKGLSLGIYNVTGQLVSTFIPTSNSYTLDVSTLNAGTYILRDMNGNATAIKFQVVK